MKYASVNGKKTHARDVKSGTIGRDLWYNDFEVKACVGKYRQYWVYLNGEPEWSEGYEPESEWHSSWKECLLDQYTEVICGEKNEHRADILTNEFAIEIQKSKICGFEVQKRIDFYNNLTNTRVIWLVNVFEPYKKGRIKTVIRKGNKNQFIIKWNKKWDWVYDIAINSNTHLYIDVGINAKNLIKVWRHEKQLIGSWYRKEAFFKEYLNEYSKDEFQNNSDFFLNSLKSNDC